VGFVTDAVEADVLAADVQLMAEAPAADRVGDPAGGVDGGAGWSRSARCA